MAGNLVTEAIQGYSMMDNIFRQKRLDAESREDREYNRQRQRRSDDFADEQHQRQRDEWDRMDKTRRLHGLLAKVKSGGELAPEELAQVTSDVDTYLGAVAQLHNDVPAAISGDKEASQRLLSHINTIDNERFTLGGQRYGKPVALKQVEPGKFIIEGEFADFMRSDNGTVIVGKDGKPMIDESTRRVAPLTKGKSADPNDPVNIYTLNEIMPKILEKGKALSEIRAQLASLGDPTAIKESGEIADAQSAAKAYRVLAEDPENKHSKKKLVALASMLETGELSLSQADGVLKALKIERDPMEMLMARDELSRERDNIRADRADARAAAREARMDARAERREGGGSDGKHQTFMTRQKDGSPPMIETIAVDSPMYERYMRGDYAMTGRTIPVGRKGQMTQNQAYSKLMALNPVTESVSSEEIRDGKAVKVNSKQPKQAAIRQSQPAAAQPTKPAAPAQSAPDPKRYKFVGYSDGHPAYYDRVTKKNVVME